MIAAQTPWSRHGADAGRAWQAAAAVVDPEVPVITIEDLGVLRELTVTDDAVEVVLTPTYSGCPAMDAIREDVVRALTAAGFPEVRVHLTLTPAWTTDWITDTGKAALREYGIAPPGKAGPVKLTLGVKCPNCGSLKTREIAHFGSTSCTALYVCESCSEPFDHFKAL